MAELKEVPTEELLSFHDYPTSTASHFDAPAAAVHLDISPEKSNFPEFNSTPTSPRDNIHNDENIDEPTKTASIWSVEYFQKYFDVDTSDVQSRLLGSVMPMKTNLLRAEIRLKPDLYGPFWIAVTLIFTIAISGNISNYFQFASSTHKYHWKYDFHLVSYAATAIFLYITLVPVCLWGLLKSTLNDNELEEFRDSLPGALELICIYGYSLFIYIPTSILWTIQINWLQWLLVLVAALVSGTVLVFTLSSSLKNSRHKLIIGVAILSCHLLLAAGFMLFFFHVPSVSVSPIVSPNASVNSNNTVALHKA